MLILEPKGGLANRLRSIDSLIAFKIEKNERVCILWHVNSRCNERFKNLFEVPKEIDYLFELKSCSFINLIRKLFKISSSISSNYFIDNKIVRKWKLENGSAYKSISNILNKLSDRENIYLQTVHRFYYSSKYRPYSSFLPVSQIQNKVDQLQIENMIGIHVRRTDNPKSISFSPIDDFIHKMSIELESDKTVKFFLATDDYNVKENLEEIFPGKIITRNLRSLDRSDPYAIQDALVDLLLLSKCRKIIGSYWSSFTDVAGEFSGTEKEIVINKNL